MDPHDSFSTHKNGYNSFRFKTVSLMYSSFLFRKPKTKKKQFLSLNINAPKIKAKTLQF